MAWGTPLEWIQAPGGWTTAKLLLDVYGHFLPSEYTGYSDALSRPANAPLYLRQREQQPSQHRGSRRNGSGIAQWGAHSMFKRSIFL
jgi:hypothetical protein